MAFQDVTAAAIESLNAQSQDQSETGISQESNTQEGQTQEVQDLFDLDSAEKFRYQGKEWTPKELERAILRQQDYTKKTQNLSEREKQWSEKTKYSDNLQIDIEAVLDNPHLVDVFKQTYPKQYHKIVDMYLERGQSAANQGQAGTPKAELPKEFLQEFNQIKSTLSEYQKEKQEAVVKSHEAQIDNTLNGLVSKLNVPKEIQKVFNQLVINEATIVYNNGQGTKLTPQVWEQIGKAVNQELSAGFKTIQSQQIQEQKQASAKGKDTGGGGGTPGQAPQKMSLKDVKYHMAKVLGGKPLTGI